MAEEIRSNDDARLLFAGAPDPGSNGNTGIAGGLIASGAVGPDALPPGTSITTTSGVTYSKDLAGNLFANGQPVARTTGGGVTPVTTGGFLTPHTTGGYLAPVIGGGASQESLIKWAAVLGLGGAVLSFGIARGKASRGAAVATMVAAVFALLALKRSAVPPIQQT